MKCESYFMWLGPSPGGMQYSGMNYIWVFSGCLIVGMGVGAIGNAQERCASPDLMQPLQFLTST